MHSHNIWRYKRGGAILPFFCLFCNLTFFALFQLVPATGEDGLTDRILQWGPLKEYDNELFKRFVEKVVVREKGLEIRFKAGLVVKAC